MSVGMSGSVLGMYGLLLVTSIWNMLHQSSLTIPLNVVKRLAPVAAIFVLYKLTTTGLGNVAELAALGCGLIGGIVLMRDVDERTPQIRPLASAMATVVAVVTLYAVFVLHRPLNETVDVRSEIDQVIAVEARTASLYDKEIERFRKGRINAAALADVIEKTIVPELQVAAGRLRTLQDVPPEHQPLRRHGREVSEIARRKLANASRRPCTSPTCGDCGKPTAKSKRRRKPSTG